MKGIELSKNFFYKYGKPIFSALGEIYDELCFGLVGSGSECFGYDDALSQDHDFGLGFCVFVPDELTSKQVFELERTYCSLPREWEGYKRNIVCPVGGNRQGIIKISDFLTQKIGFDSVDISLEQWFYIPEYSLAETINGELFEDNLGLMSEIRKKLAYYPDDVRIKKLAGNLLLINQSGQYNYPRCAKRGETGAAQLAVGECVKSIMQTIFLLNKKYMPYYKWSFRAMRELPILPSLSKDIEYLLSSPNDEQSVKNKVDIIEKICDDIAQELTKQGLSDEAGNDLEKHAYAVNDKVKDHVLRTKNILWAI